MYNSMEYTSFKTKVRLTNYTRERINNIGLCEDIKSTPDDWNFFQFLFTRHPSFPAKFENLKNVAIRYNERKRTQLECILIKNDGTEDSVSWVNCCNMRKEDSQPKAMRTAIQPQIDMFKKNTPLKCAQCSSFKNPHIDHYRPQFIELTTNFLAEWKGDVPTEYKKIKGNNVAFDNDNDPFILAWEVYHKTNATMRVLCAKCNLSRPKAKINN